MYSSITQSKILFMRVLLLLGFITILLSTGCQRRAPYMVQDFETRTLEHRVIAILPFELSYTGRLPKDWTEEMAETMRKREAISLQASLQSAILNRVSISRNNYAVDFLSTATVNNKLRAAGITPYLAYLEDPAKITEILGVDAVVNTSANKERYLSDEASAVISTAAQIVSTAGNGVFGNAINLNARTYSVAVNVALVDERGIVLYNDRSDISMDWTTTPNEAIELLGNRISRTFPYRDFLIR